jgi:hypothetical protein
MHCARACRSSQKCASSSLKQDHAAGSFVLPAILFGSIGVSSGSAVGLAQFVLRSPSEGDGPENTPRTVRTWKKLYIG